MFSKIFHFCIQYINLHSLIYIHTVAACNLLNCKCNLQKTSLLAFLKSLSGAKNRSLIHYSLKSINLSHSMCPLFSFASGFSSPLILYDYIVR